MDELQTIAPPRRSVPFRGEVLVVGPLRLEQLAPFITASRPIIGRVVLASGLMGQAAPVEVGAMILDLFEQDALAFAQALAVVTDKEPDWLAAGELDEVATLVEAVVALNKDFFVRRLPALLAAARPATAAPTSPPEAEAKQQDGTTSSSTSSPEATADATS
ncbi:MAG: hypothetical protein KKH61_11680 [Gammaproteobacteria bacterium]|nr:hypothetical protein [Gammaproteobacteria bacterium]